MVVANFTLLLIFIGWHWHGLAWRHRRRKWLFAALGILIYYTAFFICSVLIMWITGDEKMNDYFLTKSFICLLAGIVSTFIVYKVLQRRWEAEKKARDERYK